MAEASSWPTVFGTALLMSKDLKYKDSKVLVIGGGTSVGRYLVQLAKQGGAKEVVVTCSPRTEDVIKSLGLILLLITLNIKHSLSCFRIS